MTFTEYTNKQERFGLTCNMTGALMALRGGPASGAPYIRVGGLGPPGNWAPSPLRTLANSEPATGPY